MSTPDFVTLLQAEDSPRFSTAKRFTPDGTTPFNAGMFFSPTEEPVGGIRDLASLLEQATDPALKLLIIRGKLRSDLAARIQPGQLVRRRKGSFDEAAHYWMLTDFDQVRVPGADVVLAPEEAVLGVILQALPEYFHDATCFWQLSSSAGMSGDDLVRVHIWWWLDRLVSDRELTSWAGIAAPLVDDTLFRTVQPHFIANPFFDGVPDPLTRRTGLLEGSRDDVAFPIDWLTAPEQPKKERTPTIQSEPSVSYEERLEKLGDGPGLGGFHEVIRNAIWAYVKSGAKDFEQLKEDLRERLEVAPRDDSRELGRYLSDEYLDDSIDGAVKKLAEESAVVSEDDFKNFAKKEAGRTNDRDAAVGRALEKVADGVPFTEDKSVALVLPKMVSKLAWRFEEYDPDSIARLFTLSLQQMRGPTTQEIAFQIRVEQARLKDEKQKATRVSRRRIREAFKNGRDQPYTSEELAGFPENRWIIQRDKSFYIFFAGSYTGPFTQNDVLNAAVRELAPAKSAGVELFRTNPKGEVTQKTINQLVQEYGTVATDTIIDLCAQETTYDEQRRTIIEAPCPMRPLTPTYHEEIDRWLRAFAGELYEKLKNWLAAVPLLESPAPALFATGLKDTGKSLLAEGIARIWSTRGPSTLEEAFNSFNDALVRCPFVFADEHLPKDFRGYAKNAELRKHIQETWRPFKRKFMPSATLLGATRTMIAANNEDILATGENLSAFDIDAIVDRYLHIPVQREAAEYLAELNARGGGTRSVTKSWVEGDKIAEHVLWLWLMHEWVPEGRFLIKIDGEKIRRSFATRVGIRSALCQWLVGYVLDPRGFDAAGDSKRLVRIRDKKLLANVQGIIQHWDDYVKNEKCPPTGILSRELKAISDPEEGRRQYKNEFKDVIAYRTINIENLVEWAETNGYADRETIEKKLERDTEELAAKLPAKERAN